MKSIWRYILGFLALIGIVVWIAVVDYPDGRLHLIACDVGQGDAILAVYKNIQILTDGGPTNNKVIDCLSKYMPFWDRQIEVVILTHPQLDHFGGLIEVFKRYKVDNFIANAVDNSSQDYEVLKKLVGGSSTRVVNPKEGMVISYDLMYLDILNPHTNLFGVGVNPTSDGVLGSYTTKRDLNDYSVVAILSLGEFDALLTGDIGPEMEKEFLAKGAVKPIEYIKVPHHGSKNGLTKELLDAADPSIAVISVGKNNTYGHPHEEILKILRDIEQSSRPGGLKILRTDEKGDVEIVTDGKVWWVK